MTQRKRHELWIHRLRFTSMNSQCDLEKVIQLLWASISSSVKWILMLIPTSECCFED